MHFAHEMLHLVLHDEKKNSDGGCFEWKWMLLEPWRWNNALISLWDIFQQPRSCPNTNNSQSNRDALRSVVFVVVVAVVTWRCCWRWSYVRVFVGVFVCVYSVDGTLAAWELWWETVSRSRRLENVDSVFKLCSDVVLAMLLAFLTCYVAQSQCDEHSNSYRHSYGDHDEFIVDATVWLPCKRERQKDNKSD